MLEFVVGDADHFESFDEAAAEAVSRSATQGVDVTIDVLVYDADDARAWGGEAAVDSYDEDPDASVFERIVVKAYSRGRVP
jgi:hypothetical protein